MKDQLVSWCSIHLEHQTDLTFESAEQFVGFRKATNTFIVRWAFEERLFGGIDPVCDRVVDCQIRRWEQAGSAASKISECLIADSLRRRLANYGLAWDGFHHLQPGWLPFFHRRSAGTARGQDESNGCEHGSDSRESGCR